MQTAPTPRELLEDANGVRAVVEELPGHSPLYLIVGRGEIGDRAVLTVLRFQDGPVKKVGVNGPQIDHLLAICQHQLNSLDPNGDSWENRNALRGLQDARTALASRTSDREARDVEGTSAS